MIRARSIVLVVSLLLICSASELLAQSWRSGGYYRSGYSRGGSGCRSVSRSYGGYRYGGSAYPGYTPKHLRVVRVVPSPSKPATATPKQPAVTPPAPLPGPDIPSTPTVEPTDILSYVQSNAELSVAAKLAIDSGLSNDLTEKGPYTIFVPTNSAFAKIGDEALKAIEGDPKQLKELLLAHVVPAKYDAEALGQIDSVTTSNEKRLPLASQNGVLTIGSGCKFVQTNIECTNGVVHLIDTVLTPDVIASSE